MDISRPEGQEIVRRLAAQSDILLENYKVGALKRYGLGYEDLRQINARLIYCSITGFGQSGPLSHLAGYDFMIQGLGGLLSITGERDEAPGGGPQKVGVAFADLMTGMYSAVAVLAALAYREKSGVGQYIDMALLDVQVAALANMNMNYLVSGVVPGRFGNAHANIVPYQVFPCRDGHIILAVGNDSQFAKFCDVAGQPALAQDPRFAKNPERVRNRGVLIPVIQEILMQRPAREWIDLLDAVGVPCGPINNIAQVFENPQVQHRGMKIDVAHPLAGTVSLVASPLKLSETPPRHDHPPPLLGEHTGDILRGLLGMNDAEMEGLAARGII